MQTKRKKRPSLIWSFTLGLLITLTVNMSVQAAGTIFFFFGPIGLTLNISSLENFAKTGDVDTNLRTYLRNTTPEQQKEFRQALLEPVPINPVLLSRFLNTSIGEDILDRLGRFINIRGRINGKFAIRGALIQASFEPDGLTMLGFLRKLPTDMQIDIQQVLNLTRAIDLVVTATNQFKNDIVLLSDAEVKATPPVDYSLLSDLRQPGQFKVIKERMVLKDQSRNREFYVDIYRPQTWPAGKTNVIIYSHGLASRPEDFARQGEFLASYGFFVALPQHPGSDFQQVQGLLSGLSNQVFSPQDFIERPKDVIYLMDELQRRNPTEYGGRLDMQNVGVAGHSFGGYSTLALGGATIDFEHLKRQCNAEFAFLNTSLLLQCRAIGMNQDKYNFRDDRVKAVFGANPVNSSIFGPEGLRKVTIPVFLAAGTYDPATPAVFEQVRSFPWINSEDKYLGVIEGQAHVDFSVLDAGISSTLQSMVNLTLPSPQLVDTYGNAMLVAFFKVHLAGDESFRPFLESRYFAYISEGQTFKSYLITTKSSAGLVQKIEEFRRRYGRIT
ncbi:MAG: hypothetical protein N5P05_001581 [Chroococcopsis gigantea SAG 12.99]|jgi:predicted dienelactone hydrolase|nr:hypothetical protein [Chroococcopsis gigantea SAG 12.99]